jgi:hypothetical protein
MDQTKVEQSTMKQILELLAKMNAIQARMITSEEQMISKLKAEREEMKAWRTEVKACREVTRLSGEEGTNSRRGRVHSGAQGSP